jgi:hypothetical protein
MTKPVTLPPITITQGVAFFQRYVFEDSSGPIDLTGWTGAFALSKRPFEKPFFTGECALGGTVGDVQISITAEDTATLDVLPILGGNPSAVFQITLTSPLPTQNQVWQGPAIIAGVFK